MTFNLKLVYYSYTLLAFNTCSR